MIFIDKSIYRILAFALIFCSTATVFGALGIAIKTGDVPANLAAFGSGLFLTTIAFVTKETQK